METSLILIYNINDSAEHLQELCDQFNCDLKLVNVVFYGNYRL